MEKDESKIETVLVKKQIIKDNEFKGYKFRYSPKTLVEEQLAKPKKQRHPAFRTTELATEEEIEKYNKKPLSKRHTLESDKNKGKGENKDKGKANNAGGDDENKSSDDDKSKDGLGADKDKFTPLD